MRKFLVAFLVPVLTLLLVAAAIALPPLLPRNRARRAAVPAPVTAPCNGCGQGAEGTRALCICPKSLMFQHPDGYFTYYCLQQSTTNGCMGGNPVCLDSDIALPCPANCNSSGCGSCEPARVDRLALNPSNKHHVRGRPRLGPMSGAPLNPSDSLHDVQSGCTVWDGPYVRFQMGSATRFAKLFLVKVDPAGLSTPLPGQQVTFYGVGHEIRNPGGNVLDLGQLGHVGNTGMVQAVVDEITYQIGIRRDY